MVSYFIYLGGCWTYGDQPPCKSQHSSVKGLTRWVTHAAPSHRLQSNNTVQDFHTYPVDRYIRNISRICNPDRKEEVICLESVYRTCLGCTDSHILDQNSSDTYAPLKKNSFKTEWLESWTVLISNKKTVMWLLVHAACDRKGASRTSSLGLWHGGPIMCADHYHLAMPHYTAKVFFPQQKQGEARGNRV